MKRERKLSIAQDFSICCWRTCLTGKNMAPTSIIENVHFVKSLMFSQMRLSYLIYFVPLVPGATIFP